MHHEDLVGARELHDALEEPLRHDRAGRVVRVVQEHQLRAARDVLVDRPEVRHEAMLGLQRHQHRLAAGEPRSTGVNRIARVSRERVVAWVKERKVEVEDRLLGPDRRDDLVLGIELDVEAALVEIPHGASEVRAATIGGVAMRLGLAHRLLHRLDDQRRRRAIGIADAEADHIHPGRALLRDLALELGERVRRDALQASTRLHAAPFRSPR